MRVFKILSAKVAIAYVIKENHKKLINVNKKLLEINETKDVIDKKDKELLNQLKNIKVLINQVSDEFDGELEDELEHIEGEISVLNIAKEDIENIELHFLKGALILIRNYNNLLEFVETKNNELLNNLGDREFSNYYIDCNKTNIYKQMSSIISRRIKYFDIFYR